MIPGGHLSVWLMYVTIDGLSVPRGDEEIRMVRPHCLPCPLSLASLVACPLGGQVSWWTRCLHTKVAAARLSEGSGSERAQRHSCHMRWVKHPDARGEALPSARRQGGVVPWEPCLDTSLWVQTSSFVQQVPATSASNAWSQLSHHSDFLFQT